MIKPILWAAGATAVVGALTFAGLTALGVDVLDEGTAQETVPQGGATGDVRLWSTRDNLAICVETGGELKQRTGAAALQSDIRDTVESTVLELQQHPDWKLEPESGAVPVRIDSGCPADAHLDCPRATVPIDCEIELNYPVKSPSEYRLFVFVLSKEDLQKATLGMPRRKGIQEHMCVSDLCDVVTYNLYTSEEETADLGEFHQLLAEALGLEKARR